MQIDTPWEEFSSVDILGIQMALAFVLFIYALNVLISDCFTFIHHIPERGTCYMRVFIGDIIYILQVLWVYFDSVFFFFFFQFRYGTQFMKHIIEDITDSPTFSGDNSWHSCHSYLPFLFYVLIFFSQYVTICDKLSLSWL